MVEECGGWGIVWRLEGGGERRDRGREEGVARKSIQLWCVPSMSWGSFDGGLLGSHGSRPQWRCVFALWRWRVGLVTLRFLFFILDGFVAVAVGNEVWSVGLDLWGLVCCGVRLWPNFLFVDVVCCWRRFDSLVALANPTALLCAGVVSWPCGSSFVAGPLSRRIAWSTDLAGWYSVRTWWMMWAANDFREIDVSVYWWTSGYALAITKSYF